MLITMLADRFDAGGVLRARGTQVDVNNDLALRWIGDGVATPVGNAREAAQGMRREVEVVQDQVSGLQSAGGAPVSGAWNRRYAGAYIQSPGSAPFVLSSTTPPAGTGATGSSTLSSEYLYQGAQTWKLTNTTTSGTINFSYTLPTAFSAPRVAPHFLLPVYIPDYKSVNDLGIVLSMGDAAFTNTYSFTYAIGPTGHADKQRNGWHFIAVSPSDWAVGAGAPSWLSTVNAVRIRFVKNASGGNDGIVHVAQPIFHQLSVAQLLLYADDVHRSFYLNGLPLADALGLRFNLAAARGWLNNATYMNDSMYRDALARGHEICVHSLNQIGVQLPDVAAATADIAFNQEYVRSIGSTFGSRHFVWPNGRYWLTDRSDMSVVNSIRDSLGFVLGRTTDDPLRTTSKYCTGWVNEPEKHNQLLIPESFPFNSGTTLAQFRTVIDDLIQRKAVGSLVLHRTAFDGTSDEMMPGVLQQMLEYVAEKNAAGALRVPTGEQFYGGLRN